MRLIALDTETTGIHRKRDGRDVSYCHRIVEIACVEILDGRLTGHSFHAFIDPCCDIDPKAVAVHGLTAAFLRGKPRFEDIARDLLLFIGSSVLIIHNAAFDISFLDKEFKLLRESDRPSGTFTVVDTLLLARQLFPGVRNSLDALCFRLGITGRQSSHSALEDAVILAKISLKLGLGHKTLS